MKCKYYKDEFCTNSDCPYCVYYCPVTESEDICIHNSINENVVKLPCKIGDIVYSNERIMFEPVIVKVITTHQSMNLPVSYTVFATAKDGYGIYLSSDNFNEDWFLTKAEAEKKLKELKEIKSED